MVKRTGGIVVRVDGALRFLPAAVALRVAPPPRVTPVPGAPSELLGITLHEGVIVPVLAVGSERGEMIVCQQPAELIGVVGAEIVQAGLFVTAAEDGASVKLEGQDVEVLDVAAVYERVRSARTRSWS
jgi:chemotaxis signal transduction protein